MKQPANVTEHDNHEVKRHRGSTGEKAYFSSLHPYEYVVARMNIAKTLRLEYIILARYHQLSNLLPIDSVNDQITVDKLIHHFMNEIGVEGANTDFKCPWFIPLDHLVLVDKTCTSGTILAGAEVFPVQVLQDEHTGTSSHDSSHGTQLFTGSPIYPTTDNYLGYPVLITDKPLGYSPMWQHLDFPRYCSIDHVEEGPIVSLTSHSILSFWEARRRCTLMMNSGAKLYGSEATGCCREHTQKGDGGVGIMTANLGEIVYDFDRTALGTFLARTPVNSFDRERERMKIILDRWIDWRISFSRNQTVFPRSDDVLPVSST